MKAAKVGLAHGVLYSTAFFVYCKLAVRPTSEKNHPFPSLPRSRGTMGASSSSPSPCSPSSSSSSLPTALAFYYGTNLVADNIPCVLAGRTDCLTGGSVITSFFAFLVGSFSLGQLAPSFKAVAVARVSMVRVLQVIKR